MRRLETDIPELVGQMVSEEDGPVAIAVSGGSDSLALMYLAGLWSHQSGRALHILTVDHGLRDAAGDEARWVAETARALGHTAEILEWMPDRTGQQAARRARHGLIAAAARRAGARTILLGHTRTDVQETLLMRLARPSTLSGAAGPQPVSISPVWPEGRDVQLARPLIGTYRTHLMAWLKSQEKNWVTDPGNESSQYERARIRKLAGRLDTARLDRITADAMSLRALEDDLLAGALDQHVRVLPSGLLELDGVPDARRIRTRLLALLLQAAAGTDRPAAPGAIEALGGDIAAGGPSSRLTLGGAWLQRRGTIVMIGRDPGEVSSEWRDGVWDGRYVTAPGASRPDTVAFLVRNAVPDGEGWRETVSTRLASWKTALRLGARLGARLADAGRAGPATIPRA